MRLTPAIVSRADESRLVLWMAPVPLGRLWASPADDHLQLDFLNSRTSSGGPPSPLNPNRNRAGQILKGATHRHYDSAVVHASDGLRQSGLL